MAICHITLYIPGIEMFANFIVSDQEISNEENAYLSIIYLYPYPYQSADKSN